MNFIDRMTDDMRAVLPEKEDLLEELRECYWKFVEAKEQAETPLPCLNEKGDPVLFGCKLMCDSIAENYWNAKLSAVTWTVRGLLTEAEQNTLEQEMPGLSFRCYPAKYIPQPIIKN